MWVKDAKTVPRVSLITQSALLSCWPLAPAPPCPTLTPLHPHGGLASASAPLLISGAKEHHFLPVADKILIKTEEQSDSPSVDVC